MIQTYTVTKNGVPVKAGTNVSEKDAWKIYNIFQTNNHRGHKIDVVSDSPEKRCDDEI